MVKGKLHELLVADRSLIYLKKMCTKYMPIDGFQLFMMSFEVVEMLG